MFDDDAIVEPTLEFNVFPIVACREEFCLVTDDSLAPISIGGTRSAIRFEVIHTDRLARKFTMDGEQIIFPIDAQ